MTDMDPLTPSTPSIGSKLRAFYVLATSFKQGDFLVTFSLEKLECLTRADLNALEHHQRVFIFTDLLLAFVCICRSIGKHEDAVKTQQYLLVITSILKNCTTFPVVRICHNFLNRFQSILILPLQSPYDMPYGRPTATQLVIWNIRGVVLELLLPMFKNFSMDNLNMTEFEQEALFDRCDRAELKILRLTKRKTEERAKEIHTELVKYMIPDLANIVKEYNPPPNYLRFLGDCSF